MNQHASMVMVRAAAGRLTFTLPEPRAPQKYMVLGGQCGATVVDHTGRRVATLAPDSTTTFEIQPAPWWRFWDRRERWGIGRSVP